MLKQPLEIVAPPASVFHPLEFLEGVDVRVVSPAYPGLSPDFVSSVSRAHSICRAHMSDDGLVVVAQNADEADLRRASIHIAQFLAAHAENAEGLFRACFEAAADIGFRIFHIADREANEPGFEVSEKWADVVAISAFARELMAGQASVGQGPHEVPLNGLLPFTPSSESMKLARLPEGDKTAGMTVAASMLAAALLELDFQDWGSPIALEVVAWRFQDATGPAIEALIEAARSSRRAPAPMAS
jgi:hypothetical protein